MDDVIQLVFVSASGVISVAVGSGTEATGPFVPNTESHLLLGADPDQTVFLTGLIDELVLLGVLPSFEVI